MEGGKRLFSKAPISPLCFTQRPVQWVLMVLSTEAKRSEHTADHSPPSRPQFRMSGALPPLPQEEHFGS